MNGFVHTLSGKNLNPGYTAVLPSMDLDGDGKVGLTDVQALVCMPCAR